MSVNNADNDLKIIPDILAQRGWIIQEANSKRIVCILKQKTHVMMFVTRNRSETNFQDPVTLKRDDYQKHKSSITTNQLLSYGVVIKRPYNASLFLLVPSNFLERYFANPSQRTLNLPTDEAKLEKFILLGIEVTSI